MTLFPHKDHSPAYHQYENTLSMPKKGAGLSLSPLQKHVRKVVGGSGKKSCVRTGVRKPGNTCASPTAMILLTLAVKVALNPNTNKQPTPTKGAKCISVIHDTKHVIT